MNNSKFEQAANLIQKLNGITKKTSERLVVDLVTNPQKTKDLLNALEIIEESLDVCPICYYLMVDHECPICSDDTRNRDQIMVVSSILDARTIEESQTYHGLYAIVGGEINLAKNVGPQQLHINQIFQRVHENTELILAFNATFNGEVTANYIRELARKYKVNYSKIARGIPVGGVIDYMDETTLGDSIKYRSKDKEN